MRILIAAGGTGGHIFPAMRLADEILCKRSAEVFFVTSSRPRDGDILRRKGIRFYTLPVIGARPGSIFFVMSFTARLVMGTIKSLALLLILKPDVAVGFGGYVTGPIILLASFLGAKTIIHEQNVYPGRANRILARFADKIAINFPESRKYLDGFESKIFVSGNPLRKEIGEEKAVFKERFTLLAMGGSQGSRTLNRIIPEALGLMQEDRKNALEVIHISGYSDKSEIEKAYKERNIRNHVMEFTDQIHKFYSKSDFVISRAGATTVSELLFLAKPSILIPYPHAKNHQRFNAELLNDRGIAVLLEEENLTPEGLKNVIMTFMDRQFLSEMSDAIKKKQSEVDPCSVLIKEVFA